MKRGTPDHPKTLHLAKLLNIPIYSAVGILEMLWHFTAKFAPQGDIGKYPDAAIAAAIGWSKPTGTKGVTPAFRLIDSLVRAGFLDSDHPVTCQCIPSDMPVTCQWTPSDYPVTCQCIFYRLIVHDWPDHADQSVTKLLDRQRLSFVRHVDSLPLPKPLPKPEPTPPAREAIPVTPPPPPPRAAAPNTEPRRARPLAEESMDSPQSAMAERMYARHPKRKDKPLVEQAICRLWLRLRDPETETAEIERVHALWCEEPAWQKENGRYAPSLATWLTDEGWGREPVSQVDEDPFVASCLRQWEARDAERAAWKKAAKTA